ncbi:MAG: sugar phosphate nucleotidyltransferase [Acidobacteriota bacterium]
MQATHAPWAIVLAAGDGSRLGPYTAGPDGAVVPKQYCSFRGGPSLLRRALDRAAGLARRENILVVVAAQHRRWWRDEVADLPDENVVVQPCNRGTACGLLLPLAHVRLRAAGAAVAVLPSDHHVDDEWTFTLAMRRALRVATRDGEHLVLLGISPDGPDTGYGWIRTEGDTGRVPGRVVSFIEKPDAELAERLLERGALWNSFTFVAQADALWEMFRRRLPWLVERFSLAFAAGEGAWWRAPLWEVYETLPSLDFSRVILERAGESLRVVPVPPCGWTDLGTPERVSACIDRLGVGGEAEARASDAAGRAAVDLAVAVRTRSGQSLQH